MLHHQLLVSAHLGGTAMLHRHDQVGTADGGEAMGDDDGTAALSCLVKEKNT